MAFLLGALAQRRSRSQARRNPEEVVAEILTAHEYITSPTTLENLQKMLISPKMGEVYNASIGDILAKYSPKGKIANRKTAGSWGKILQDTIRKKVEAFRKEQDAAGMTGARRVGKKLSSKDSLPPGRQEALFGSAEQEPLQDSGTLHHFWLHMDGNSDPEAGPIREALDRDDQDALLLAYWNILEEALEEDLNKAQDFIQRGGTSSQARARELESLSRARLSRLYRAQRLMSGPVLAQGREPQRVSDGYRPQDIAYVLHINVEKLMATMSKAISQRAAEKRAPTIRSARFPGS
jgi:hypothetical protein